MRNHRMSPQVLAVLIVLAGTIWLSPLAHAQRATTPAAAFTVTTGQPGQALPPVVVQYDKAAGTGFNWDEIRRRHTDDRIPTNVMRVTVEYIVEAVRRMTGQTPPVQSSNDLSRGIILTTLAGAGPALQGDRAVQAALRNSGEDAYNNHEAYYLRSEPARVLVIANNWEGLSAGVAALLETVDYEILGMGPNWIHVPDYRTRPLRFQVNSSGRPDYYVRGFNGGSYNGSTYHYPPKAPGDEHVIDSLNRWKVGWRLWGRSVPPYPGHALDSYHDDLIKRMREQGTTEGFLTPGTALGLDAARPAAAAANTGQLWINTDAEGAPEAGKVYVSNGRQWNLQRAGGLTVSLDLSTPLARAVMLDAMKRAATHFFKSSPDDIFVFGTEPEDGSYAEIARDVKYPDWYPRYLAAEKQPFGRPYALHNFRGLNQPREMWDPKAASDHVFAFNNWLLREYDKWLASLPEAERRTATGKLKSAQTRTSLYSYNFHDVPPNFNLDGRIRLMVAGYPKHRGAGKWLQLATYGDIAAAFKVLLPREPSGEYRIISLTDYHDHTLNGIPAAWSAAPQAIYDDLHSTFQAGTRSLAIEMDFNAGKYGLGYYLMSKMMWDAELTPAQLGQLRQRWLQRAYGRAWREMQTYYDFMLPENYPLNSPGVWGQAIALMDRAGAILADGREPDALKRLDDMKQFWYFYYLLDRGKNKPDDRDFQEFMWKSQMSYVTATDMTIDFFPAANRNPGKAAPEFADGPARYTHEETARWWQQVRAHWPAPQVTRHALTQSAVTDLVAVKELQSAEGGLPLGIERQAFTFYSRAARRGETLGFQLLWPHEPGSRTGGERVVDYRVFSREADGRWAQLGDRYRVASAEIKTAAGVAWQRAQGRLAAARPGLYRFEVGSGGSGAMLAPLTYDLAVATPAFTVAGGLTAETSKLPLHNGGRVFFFVPKGTATLDVEVRQPGSATLVFHQGWPAAGMKATRQVKLELAGAQSIPLQTGEDNSLVAVELTDGRVLNLPYMYSVPNFWARTPASLLIPRSVAKASGLTVVE